MATRVWFFAEDRAPADRFAAALGAPTRVIGMHHFPDGESRVTAASDGDVAIVYRSLDRANAKILDLLLAADALRRSGARRVVLVAPYLGYMRQDAVFASGEALGQRVIGDLLAGAFDRVACVDPHLHRTACLKDAVPAERVDDISAAPAIAVHLAARETPVDSVIVGPDRESAGWTQKLAALIERPWTTFSKTRRGDHDVRLDPPPRGAVAGRPCVIVDDICSGGSTLRAALTGLAELGAGPCRVVVTHALFPPEVAVTLMQAGAVDVASTDSVAHPTNQIALASVLAQALADEVTP